MKERRRRVLGENWAPPVPVTGRVHYPQHWPCTNGSWADTQFQLNLHMVPFQLESWPIATFLPHLGRQMDKKRRLDGDEGEPPGSRREGGQG